jgi:hypothetical protein
MGRPVVRRRAAESLGRRAARDRDAKRGRRGRRCARGLAGRSANDDVYRFPGPLAHDPQHVQDRRGTDAGSDSCGGAVAGRPGPLHLLRSQRCDGGPGNGLRHAGLQLGAGGHGLCPDCPCGYPRIARAVPASLRRLPYLTRSDENQGPAPGNPGRDARPPANSRAPGSSAIPRPACNPGYHAESGRLFSGSRIGEPVLPCLSRDRAKRDGPVRPPDRPVVSPVRLCRGSRCRAGDCAHGLSGRSSRRSYPGASWKRPEGPECSRCTCIVPFRSSTLSWRFPGR